MITIRKKLIEVALPLEAINKAAAREKSIRHGHPSTLHLWWARRPLAAARAVIFAQMVDDPSASPDLFPTEKAQEKERKRLFKIIEELVQWENTTNEEVLQRARDEIWESWRRSCAENAGHPRAKELFNRNELPAFHDPFAGGGALPLEAQRLGLKVYASDLNPVAVLICKAMIEIPPKFAGNPPVNPESRRKLGSGSGSWKGAQGLAEDVRYYGQWMREEAEKRIGRLYPKIEITKEMAKERHDLKPLVGRKLTVIAWLWARTVKSPNPAFRGVDVPLVSNFMLSTKPGEEAYVEPVVTGNDYKFTVKLGRAGNPDVTKKGTKLGRGANFQCVMSGVPISGEYIKSEGKAGRMSSRLMAIVAVTERTRIYLSPSLDLESLISVEQPKWKPETPLPEKALGFSVQLYFNKGTFSDLFTARQLSTLTTFSDLVAEARGLVEQHALDSDLARDDRNNAYAKAYADAIGVYLGLAASKETVFLNTLARWRPGENKSAPAFGRQAIPLTWDYADLNPFAGAGGDFGGIIDGTVRVLNSFPAEDGGFAEQQDAATQSWSNDKLISTDPPYYDNIAYADLSDFFYGWLRSSQKAIFPALFSTVSTPKQQELVATPYLHGSKIAAEKFFLDGMTKALRRLADQTHPSFPVTIYYAFKQSEVDDEKGVSSTGWETFLDAVIRAGFTIDGTWPIRTEGETRLRGQDANALASSVVLVCRPEAKTRLTSGRRDLITELKLEFSASLAHLQRSNIAPVDLAQAAIGPGMAVYTRYANVLDAEGKSLSVGDALGLINETLDTALAEQEGDFDADTRWALAWFEQYGFSEGEFGVAETLSKAKNTSVGGIVEAGIARSKAGKVRLLKPSELDADWNPETDSRLTNWEMVHHLIRALESKGEAAAAEIAAKLGTKAEAARDLCYRLYTVCERKKRATEALSYNGVVQSWPEIMRLAKEKKAAIPVQQELV